MRSAPLEKSGIGSSVMGEPAASTKPSAPRPADLLRMLGQLRRGSAADAPLGVIPALKELVRGTPADSSLTLKDVVRSETYRDLATPNVRPGDLAPDFELARLDLSEGTERQTGETVPLSAYRRGSPVALVLGSYTRPPL